MHAGIARAFLLEALQRVSEGGDVSAVELDTVVSNPLALSRVEKDAWEELSHWIDDADIRQRNRRYDLFKRKRMRDHIGTLSLDRS